jgi:hypothetical protein
MSAARKAELHPDEKITIRKWGRKVFLIAGVIGVLGLLLTALLGFRDSMYRVVGEHEIPRFFYSYLVAFAYFLSVALGALFFVVLQHLVRARWSVVVRRLAEILTATFPALLLLSLPLLIPLLLGNDGPYGLWVSPPDASSPDLHEAQTAHVLHGKAFWLNAPFFAIRIVLYFAVWIGISRYFFKRSVAQDTSGDPAISERLRVVSAPSIIAFAITLCLAAFDLLMSVNPLFFSTIFGVYYFAGAAMSIFATLSLVSLIVQKKGRLTHSITIEHYHDLGKLMFAFVFFWSYIAFSQFMLIWYANIPEETFWFQPRMFTSWKGLSLLLLFGHTVFPFLCLLSRWTKRILPLLAFFCVWMLTMHFFDMFWLVMPEFTPRGFMFDWSDITAMIGVGGVFVAAAARAATKVNLIPVKDPALGDSLRFENF